MEKTEQLLQGSLIDCQIQELDAKVNAAIGAGKNADWKAVWNAIRSLGALYKEAWFPSVQERRASWERFQTVAKRAQAQRDQAQKRREAFDIRKGESRRIAEKIMDLARAAWPHENGFLEFLGTITGAKLLAFVFVAMIEVGVQVMTFGLLKPHRDDDPFGHLKACSQSLREAWALYHEHREAFIFEDRRAMREVLLRTQTELQAEWDKLKSRSRQESDARVNEKRSLIAEARSLRLHDSSTVGEWSKELMRQWQAVGFVGSKEEENELWLTFRAALDGFWEERKKSGRNRLEGALEATRANVEKLRSSVQHDEGVLASMEEKLANVFDGRRADEIREHLREVITSLEEKIERKRRWISEQEGRIEEMERAPAVRQTKPAKE